MFARNKKIDKSILIVPCVLLGIMIFACLFFIYPYIIFYNQGNKAYEEWDYGKAEEYYSKALKGYVPEYKECDIRDNWALTILAELPSIEEIPDDEINDALSELHRASDILTEEGCADDKNSDLAHDLYSQNIEDEILEYIRILEERKTSASTADEKKDDSKEDAEPKENKEVETQQQRLDRERQEKLSQEQKAAATDRTQTLDWYYYIDDYEYYSGKNW